MVNSKTTSDQLIFSAGNSIPLNQDKTSARATWLRATTTLTDTARRVILDVVLKDLHPFNLNGKPTRMEAISEDLLN
jgi:hypothetical protein